jgi:protein TonB
METKKKPEVNVYRKKPLFFNIGLVVALAVVISAFEYKTYDPIPEVDVIYNMYPIEDVLPPIPNTEVRPTPPPPAVPLPKLSEEIEIVKEDFPELVDLEPIIKDQPETTGEGPNIEWNNLLPEAETADYTVDANATVTYAEKMPAMGEKMEGFYKYISKHLKYPSRAQSQEIQGKVYVEFTVDKDGSVKDAVVVKGIGGGCDEEALRVVKNSPKWEPGMQGGRPVKVRMTIPITFSLSPQ